MVIHPIIVHFPIALLVMYALLEVISLFSFGKRQSFSEAKKFLLIVGTVSIPFALSSGESIAHQFGIRNQILPLHELFANLSSGIFWTLTILYSIDIVKNTQFGITFIGRFSENILIKIMLSLHKALFTKSFIVTLAIVGFLALLFTGALGGAMVYGIDNDPIAQFIVSFTK